MEEMAKLPEGKIAGEAFEKYKQRVGMKLRVRQFNEFATRDNIRKFCYGVGDDNPLWLDEGYARKTRYGRIVAPPSWLYSVFPTWVLQGLPGVHAYHSGNDWKFYRPVLEGDRILAECTFTGFEEVKGRFAGRMLKEYQLARYYNQWGQLVAEAVSWLFRAERQKSRSVKKYEGIQLPHKYSEEELREIEESMVNERPRGAKTLYWEDVEIDDQLPTIVKGPFGLTDMVAFCVGADPVGIAAFRVSRKNYQKHPSWCFRDPETCSPEPIYAVHYNKYAPKALGLPYPFDVGAQRQCFQIHLLTDFMGDEGWLKRCYAEYRRFFYLSDTIWLTGKVVKKYVDEDGEKVIDIETHAINQRGEDIMPGKATIALPSKDDNYYPVEVRLKDRLDR